MANFILVQIPCDRIEYQFGVEHRILSLGFYLVLGICKYLKIIQKLFFNMQGCRVLAPKMGTRPISHVFVLPFEDLFGQCLPSLRSLHTKTYAALLCTLLRKTLPRRPSCLVIHFTSNFSHEQFPISTPPQRRKKAFHPFISSALLPYPHRHRQPPM